MRSSLHILMVAGLASAAGCSDTPGTPGSDAGIVDFAGADFAGADFAGADFAGADLATAADGPRSTDLSTVDTGGACPHPVGSDSISARGLGCGDLDVNA